MSENEGQQVDHTRNNILPKGVTYDELLYPIGLHEPHIPMNVPAPSLNIEGLLKTAHGRILPCRNPDKLTLPRREEPFDEIFHL